MKNLTWQNPEQLFVAQELINKVKSKCCGIKVIVAIILFVISLCIEKDKSSKETIETLKYVSFFMVVAGIYGLFFAGKEYLDKGMKTNIEIMEKYKNLFGKW